MIVRRFNKLNLTINFKTNNILFKVLLIPEVTDTENKMCQILKSIVSQKHFPCFYSFYKTDRNIGRFFLSQYPLKSSLLISSYLKTNENGNA